MPFDLVAPHGGRLQQPLDAEFPADLAQLPVLKLTPRQQCDVEMLLTGAFSPLQGFLGRDDYLAVLQTGRLADGTLWPLPVMLDVDRDTLDSLGDADRLVLLDAELYPVAVLEPRETWRPDREREVSTLYGTADSGHDGVRSLLHATASHYVGGRLRGLRLPVCRFQDWARITPAVYRAKLESAAARASLGWLASEPPTPRRLAELGAPLAACNADHLLILHSPCLAPVGTPGAQITGRCLEAVLPRLGEMAHVTYCSIPLWPRWCGVRDIVLQAIVFQNFGATHFEPDEASAAAPLGGVRRPPAVRLGSELLERARHELKIRFVTTNDADPRRLPFERASGANAADEWRAVSNQLPEVAAVLAQEGRRRAARGCAVFLTGLSGAGKSSLAHALAERLATGFNRTVSVLDGDYSRRLLTSDLGATPSDQRKNVQRHAFVAAEIVRHGGIAVVALVAPEGAARAEARRAIETHGDFIEVYLAAPAVVCEARDGKGVYARVRRAAGNDANIAEHYEAPAHPDVVADSACHDTATLVAQVVDFLLARGCIERQLAAPAASAPTLSR